ncbi:MAG TPA: hypothetical protein VGP02_11195 [Mycobacteriales bacterium]|nr:hypothetical protein [Mycobacteriales bacterium]
MHAAALEARLRGRLREHDPHGRGAWEVQRTVAAPALALRPSYLACGEMTSLPDAPTTAALLRH